MSADDDGDVYYGSSSQITNFDENILPYYYILYFITTMLGQIAVLLLILLKTPPFFRDFRLFLVNSSILQILICITLCFTQLRPVYNKNSTAFLFSGYCKSFNKIVCLFSYDLFQLFFNASSCSVPCILWYKHIKLIKMSRQGESNGIIGLIFLSSYVFSIFVGVLYIITYNPADFLKIETETLTQFNGTYNFSHYAQITGYLANPWSALINALNTLSVYIPPVLSLIFLRLIHKKLENLHHMFSEKTAQQAKKFDMGLTIQTLLPAICVLPAYSFHLLLAVLDVHDLIFLDKGLFIMLSLPTAIDGFVIIITVTPYRRAFVSFITRKSHLSSQVTQINGGASRINNNNNSQIFNVTNKL